LENYFTQFQFKNSINDDGFNLIGSVLEDAIDCIVRELESENFFDKKSKEDIPIFYHLSQRPSDMCFVESFEESNVPTTDILAG
jgi:hypothetical protein